MAGTGQMRQAGPISVRPQFEFTPKGFANFSPELERSDNPGNKRTKHIQNPERVRGERNPFRVERLFQTRFPELERSDNPGNKRTKHIQNPERVRGERNPFRVERLFQTRFPELSLRSNSGLKLANAFGVISRVEICERVGANLS